MIGGGENDNIPKLPYVVKSEKLEEKDIELICTELRDKVEALEKQLINEKKYNMAL